MLRLHRKQNLTTIRNMGRTILFFTRKHLILFRINVVFEIRLVIGNRRSFLVLYDDRYR